MLLSDFQLPAWYINMMSQTHEKIFDFADGKHLHLWPLQELMEINQQYGSEENYPGFFLIGTYEIGEACAVEKATGAVYTIPFIGSVPEDALYAGTTEEEFLAYLRQEDF